MWRVIKIIISGIHIDIDDQENVFKCRRLLREFYNFDSHLLDLEMKVLPRLLTSLREKKTSMSSQATMR